jgi:hypothetical protein
MGKVGKFVGGPSAWWQLGLIEVTRVCGLDSLSIGKCDVDTTVGCSLINTGAIHG